MSGTNFQNILFLDIETVPQYPEYNAAPAEWRILWDKKAERLKEKETDHPADVYPKAGIYSEFGRIICISVAFIKNEKLFVKSFFSGDNEKKLLTEFAEMVNGFQSRNRDLQLCAHNGKEFDFPYISRRMLINRIPLPEIFDNSSKKPWEIKNLDTMELWKFGDYKNFTSLNLLSYIFNIPSPKDDIDGSMVYETFYKKNELERIVKYCEKDVITVAQLLRAFNYLPLIDEVNIEFKS
jgi:DNA polymerase elongation subunit (family B)